MRVSVVVPLYNKAPYIGRCLRSVFSQSFRDFETIVVDDGSTDGGDQLIQAEPVHNLRVFRQPNAGPGAARNRGVREAHGAYVAFLDADDEWQPDYLARSVRILDDTPAAAAVSASYVEEPAGRSVEALWRRRGIVPGLQRLTAATAPEHLVHIVAYMRPCTTVARTEILRAWGGFYDRDRCLYAEDAFLWLKVVLNRPVFFHFEPLVRIHRDAAQLSGNLKGPRPVEPFLQRPDLMRESCPPGLERLLEGFLAARAFKTACVLAYWGCWRDARRLRSQFAGPGTWRLTYAWPSLLCATPLGGVLGMACRRLVKP
jgi:glycosyltransferase involved in cell wall biosynthesis